MLIKPIILASIFSIAIFSSSAKADAVNGDWGSDISNDYTPEVILDTMRTMPQLDFTEEDGNYTTTVSEISDLFNGNISTNLQIPNMQTRTSTISVSSIKVEWNPENGHAYQITCNNISDPNSVYNNNIHFNSKRSGMCYITGLRENTEYVVQLTDVDTGMTENIYAHTEAVTILQEYDYVSGWTGCYAYEHASGLTHNPSKAAISGAVIDPVTGTGIMRDEYGDYCVAMGIYYGRCGDRFLVELENGVQFTVKICDSKGKASDGQGIYHRFGRNGKNIIEFIGGDVPYCVRQSGNYGSYSWDGLIFDNIKTISRIDYGNPITY